MEDGTQHQDEGYSSAVPDGDSDNDDTVPVKDEEDEDMVVDKWHVSDADSNGNLKNFIDDEVEESDREDSEMDVDEEEGEDEQEEGQVEEQPASRCVALLFDLTPTDVYMLSPMPMKISPASGSFNKKRYVIDNHTSNFLKCPLQCDCGWMHTFTFAWAL